MSPDNQSPDDEALAKELVDAYQKIKEQVHQVIVGQEKVLEQLLIAMLAGVTACWKEFQVWQKP